MKIENFDNHLFRCSSLGLLMTEAQLGLTEKQKLRFAELDARYKGLGKALTPNMMAEHAKLLTKKTAPPTLSQTTKTHLEQVFREVVFGRRKEINTKQMIKGTEAEKVSLTLYSEVVGKPYFKNQERKKNAYISGECDNAYELIRDIKTSWDLFTFPLFQPSDKFPSKAYWWQLQGYCELWDMDQAELVYCLVDTPEMQVTDEKFKLARRSPEMELTPEMEAQIEKNMTFEDIPKGLRVRVFPTTRDRSAIEALYKQLDRCRDYLNRLLSDMVGNYEALEVSSKTPGQ